MTGKFIFGLSLLAIVTLSTCTKSSDPSPSSNSGSNSGSNTSTVPDVYKKIYGASDIYVDGDYIVIKTTGLPDHKSPYYQGTTWSNMYEAYNGTNSSWSQNPNKISSFTYTFKIPKNPAVNAAHSATPLGAIGVSLNGVPFYNQYAGPSQPLTSEINSFDQYDGHPQQQGAYHYHMEPYYLTNTKATKSSLLGFLLDGFPVYGPTENGATVSNSDLDVYHGHTSVTADYPSGIYHYHTTSAAPYINGSGYYGTPGTVSQ